MANPSLLGDFIGFIRHEKKWWLVPLMLVLAAVGAIAVFSTSSPLAPFIYSLF